MDMQEIVPICIVELHMTLLTKGPVTLLWQNLQIKSSLYYIMFYLQWSV